MFSVLPKRGICPTAVILIYFIAHTRLPIHFQKTTFVVLTQTYPLFYHVRFTPFLSGLLGDATTGNSHISATKQPPDNNGCKDNDTERDPMLANGRWWEWDGLYIAYLQLELTSRQLLSLQLH